MSVILLRHTRLAAVEGLCYGRTDVPLAVSFADELAVIGTGLEGVSLGAVWSSPAARCQQLAAALALEAGVKIFTEPRLQELDFGAWENRPWESFRGPQSEAWSLDPWSLAPPGGESGAQLWARVGEFRTELLGEVTSGSSCADGTSTLVVTHAGVIRTWLGLERGLSWAEAMSLPVSHGSLTEINPCGR